jgi:hypothetical protein
MFLVQKDKDLAQITSTEGLNSDIGITQRFK